MALEIYFDRIVLFSFSVHSYLDSSRLVFIIVHTFCIFSCYETFPRNFHFHETNYGNRIASNKSGPLLAARISLTRSRIATLLYIREKICAEGVPR